MFSISHSYRVPIFSVTSFDCHCWAMRCDIQSNLSSICNVFFLSSLFQRWWWHQVTISIFYSIAHVFMIFCFLIVFLSMPDLVLDSKKQRHLMKKMSQLIFYSVPFLSRFWRTKYYHLKNIFYCSWHCTCQPFIMSWHHILTPNL